MMQRKRCWPSVPHSLLARPTWLCLLCMLALLNACDSRPGPATTPAASAVTLTWAVTLPAGTPPDEEIFLSGNWNQWQAADPALRLVRQQGRATLTLTVEKGQTLEYTFTRGSWAKREADETGQPVPNHVLLVETARAIDLQLAGWSDLRQEAGITTPTPDPSLVNPYDPRAQRVQLLSRALGIRKTFFIYVPPDAAAQETRKEKK